MAQYKRVYVEVEVQFISDGSMRPRALIWRDGRKYEIERILDMRPACAQKAGGQGDRYTIRTNNHETHIFFEHNLNYDNRILGRWFVERREV